MFLNIIKWKDDAKEYISEAAGRMESMLKPSSNTKPFLLDHEDKVTNPKDWWKRQSHGKTKYDVSTYIKYIHWMYEDKNIYNIATFGYEALIVTFSSLVST